MPARIRTRRRPAHFVAALALLLVLFAPLLPIQVSPVRAAENEVVTSLIDTTDPGSLRAALDAVDDGGTVTFAVTGEILLSLGEISVTKNVTIQGPGAGSLTINGNSSSRVFNIASGVNVEIRDLTISGGRAQGPPTPGIPGSIGSDGQGGGIYNAGALVLDGVIITDNEAIGRVGGPGGDGGAAQGAGIYNTGTLEVNEVIISDNQARGGGGGNDGPGVDVSGGDGGVGQGGGIYSTGTLTIANSTFSGNSVIGGYGGVGGNAGSDPPPTILSGGLGGHGGSGQGGAIFVAGDLVVNNTIFNENNAIGGFASAGGDGLSAQGGAGGTGGPGGVGGPGQGGAIHVSGDLDASNSSFTGNDAVGGSGGSGGSGGESGTSTGGTGGPGGNGGPGQGGAVYVAGDLNTSTSTFSGNDAFGDYGGDGGSGGDGLGDFGGTGGAGGNGGDGQGGAIFVAGELNVSNSTVTGNHAHGDDGASGGAGGAGPSVAGGSGGSGGNGGNGQGGGLYANGPAEATFATIVRNVTVASTGGTGGSGGFGGSNGVSGADGSAGAGGPTGIRAGATTLTASILDDSCSVDSLVSGGFNFSTSGSCRDTGDPPVIDAGDLGPGQLADNGGPTLTILPGQDSPVVDAVPAAACEGINGSDVDQRGFDRPQGESCDAGAVEVRFASIPGTDMTREANGPGGWQVDFSDIERSDWDGGEIDLSCTPAEGDWLGLGDHSFDCETEDTTGDYNVAATFTITVEDTTPPALSGVPGDMSVDTTSPAGAVVAWPPPTAIDLVDLDRNVTCDHASGSTFPLGPTTVTCTATDLSNNPASASFTVTVALPGAPAMEQPENITGTSSSPAGLVVEFDNPEAEDFNGDPLDVNCEPGTGSLFPLGTTTVTCSSEEDVFGRTVSRTFTVTIKPAQSLAPTFGATPGTVTPTTNPAGTAVTYTPQVSSLIDDNLTVVCVPPSGTFFSIGTHTITCTATDQYGLSSSMSFQLTVVFDDGSSPTPPTPPTPPVDPDPEEPGEPEEPTEPEEPQEPEEPETPVGDPSAFDDVWARTDLPVANGSVSRTWIWGPEPFSTLQEVPTELWEDYAESPDGKRLVRYYDKARMEINDPDAPESNWFVTNGLLVVELITGQMQVGDDTFIERTPADVVIAGDLDDPDSPTYADLADLLDPVESRVGETITDRLNDGDTSWEVEYAYYDEVTGHNIAAPFWEFMNSSGLVWVDGNLTEDLLFENPFYGTGRPITEAYWVTVNVGGTPHEVLLQCFERRCLTYTPENPSGWQVEAGNVGLHYFIWRYGDQ